MSRRPSLAAGPAVLLLLLAAACTDGASSPPAPTATLTPGPTLTLPVLKLALIDAYGPLWYCDPDFYPIQRQDELESARERWPELLADGQALEAIAATKGLDPAGAFTDDQKLALYREWKVLNAIALDPIGNDTFRFDYQAQPAVGAAEGTRTGGTIKATGVITVEQQAAAPEPMCPICLARGTLIDTPDGAVPIERIRIGDVALTLDEDGNRMPGAVIAIGSTDAPADHRVVRLVLADGRTVTASPGHPLGDERRLGDIEVGDNVDGSVVVSADLVGYRGGTTFDILVSGPSGVYLADGIAMGSTLRP